MMRQIQNEARMDETEEDRNGLQLMFLKTCQSNSVSELIFVVCITFDLTLGRHLFDTKL